MPFEKGKSGNPGGRAKVKLADGRTLGDLAREHTEEALAVLVKVMRNKGEPGSTRAAAADKVPDARLGAGTANDRAHRRTAIRRPVLA